MSTPNRLRPILAAVAILGGGFVLWQVTRRPPAPVSSGPAATERAAATAPAARFVDVTTDAGLGAFLRVNGATGEKLLPETSGGGGALVDVDNDGDLDVVLVNGRAWPWTPAGGPAPRSTVVLYTNDGKGHFTDTTAAAGIAVPSYGMGVAAGDFDNDGWTDLYITAVGRNVLLENVGGRFHDITAQAGVAGGADQWSTCATWFDADTDGDLDLFVCNYVRWSRDIDRAQDFSLAGVGRAYGPPRNFAGAAPLFFVNQGDGRFTERAAAAGLVVTDPVTKAPAAKSLGVALAHLDTDACLDLIVANDTVRNYAFRNRCDGTFEEVGTTLGLAYDGYGNARSGMGIDIAEVRDDGAPGGRHRQLRQRDDRVLRAAGLRAVRGRGHRRRHRRAEPRFPHLRRAVLRLRPRRAPGPADHQRPRRRPESRWCRRASSMRSPPRSTGTRGPTSATTFVPVADKGALSTPLVGRGGAYGDIDGDGDLDLLLVPSSGAVRLLRNDTAAGRWFRLRLVGTKSPHDAVGAVVEVSGNGRTRRRLVTATHGYLSQSDPALTFGLAQVETTETIRITWPSGSVQTLSGVPLGQTTTVTEVQ